MSTDDHGAGGSKASTAHRVALGSWSLWRWGRLRGAGFASARLAALSSDDAVLAADRALDEPESSDANAALERAVTAALERVEGLLADSAADPRFTEAVLWQNRNVYRNALGRLASSRGAKRRKKLRAIYRYLQRYCAKNDTIGFFGPQGIVVVDPPKATELTAGDRLVRKRRVYFEHWALSAIADAAARDPASLIQLAPRVLPALRLEGDRLIAADGRAHQLPAAIAALARRCDGQRSALDLANDAVAAGEADDVSEIYETLESLVDAQVVVWALDIPTGVEHPESFLRSKLAAIGATRLVEALARLESERDAVARSAGDVTSLAAALDQLDRSFEEIAGVSAARRPGQTYAGRTPVWEECLRDAQLTVGSELLDRFAPATELLLRSARWYTAEIGARIADRAERAVAALGDDSGPVRFVDLLAQLERDGAFDAEVDAVTEELQTRWAGILGLEQAGGTEELAFRARDIEGDVAAAFAAEAPGWPSARYHSPDILFAAGDVDDLLAGRCQAVLGEIHVAANTCALPVLLDLLDDPSPLLEARRADIGRQVVPVIARDKATRADHVWRTADDLALEIARTPSWRSRDQVLAIGDLTVERRDGRLVVDHRSDRPGSPGPLTFELFDVLDNRLSAAVIGRFAWLPALPYTPRISIDGLIANRRRWRIDPARLASRNSVAETFLAARRLGRELDLPARVFVSVPTEPKPVFADLTCPFSTDVLGRLVRGTPSMTASEMLPDLDQTWLPAEGETATCELRFVAVDPAAWR